MFEVNFAREYLKMHNVDIKIESEVPKDYSLEMWK